MSPAKGSLEPSVHAPVSLAPKSPINLPKWVYGLVLLLTVYIVSTPIVMLLYSSFSGAKNKLPFEELNLSWTNYVQALSDPVTYRLLYNTVWFTFGSMLIGIGIAIVLAWLLERTPIAFKTLIYGMIMIPMAIPNMIYAISWTQLLEKKTGIINVFLQHLFALESGPFNIFSLGGMIFVQGMHMVPTALLMIAATFSTLDPALEEQSSICGRGALPTVRRITLPILKPALISATIYFAIVAIETFEVPATLGFTARTPVLSTQIYLITHPNSGDMPNYGLASALGVMLLMFALILIWLYQRFTRNAEKFSTITGKGYRPKLIELGKWKFAASCFVWLFVIISVLLPFLTLIWTSLHPFYVVPSWDALMKSSFDAYKSAFVKNDIGTIVWNTVFMTIASAAITVILVLLIGWLVVRGPFSQRARGTLDTISFLPQAVPAVVIGLSLMFLYMFIPIPIYGTIWILIIGMITKYIAFGSRTMISAQIQISKELEEASMVCGAGWTRTMRRVLLPLLTPAILNCFIWIAVHAMRELSVVVMLYSPKTLVLSTTIWSLWEGGWTAEASVLGILLILILGALFYVGQKLSRRLVKMQ